VSGTVSLRITLRYKDVEEFVARYAENISSAGLFLRTRTPKPTGTKIRFELLLVDGTRAVAGDGVVTAVRDDDKPGMSIRFHQIEAESQALIDRMVATHGDGALAPAPLGGNFGRPASGTFSSAWQAPGAWNATPSTAPPVVRSVPPPEGDTRSRRRGSSIVRPWDVASQAVTATEVVRPRSPLSQPPPAPSPWVSGTARMDVPAERPAAEETTARIKLDDPDTTRIRVDEAIAQARASDAPFRRPSVDPAPVGLEGATEQIDTRAMLQSEQGSANLAAPDATSSESAKRPGEERVGLMQDVSPQFSATNAEIIAREIPPEDAVAPPDDPAVAAAYARDMAQVPDVLGAPYDAALLSESSRDIVPRRDSLDSPTVDLPPGTSPARLPDQDRITARLIAFDASSANLAAAASVDTSHGHATGVEGQGDPLVRDEVAMGFLPDHTLEPTAIQPPVPGLSPADVDQAPILTRTDLMHIEVMPGNESGLIDMLREAPSLLSDRADPVSPWRAEEPRTALPDVASSIVGEHVPDAGATARLDVTPWKDEATEVAETAPEVEVASAIGPAVEVDLGSAIMPAARIATESVVEPEPIDPEPELLDADHVTSLRSEPEPSRVDDSHAAREAALADLASLPPKAAPPITPVQEAITATPEPAPVPEPVVATVLAAPELAATAVPELAPTAVPELARPAVPESARPEAITALPIPALADASWASAFGLAQSDPPPAMPGTPATASTLATARLSQPVGATQRIEVRHATLELRAIDDREAVIAVPSGSAVIDDAFQSDLREHDAAAAEAQDPAPVDVNELVAVSGHGRVAKTGELVAEHTIRLDVAASDAPIEQVPVTTRIEVDSELIRAAEPAAVEPMLPPPEPMLPEPESAPHFAPPEAQTVRVEPSAILPPIVPVILGVRGSNPPPRARSNIVPSAPPAAPMSSLPPASTEAPAPEDSSSDLKLGAITSPDTTPPKPIVLDMMSARARLGSIERGRFVAVEIDGQISSPAAVALRSDGTLVTGEDAIGLPGATVGMRDLLLALAGVPSSVTTETVDGRLMIRLTGQVLEVTEVLRVFFTPFGRAMGKERHRAAVAVPAPLSPEADAMLFKSAKAAGLQASETVPFGAAAARAFALDQLQLESAVVVDVGAAHLTVAVLRRARDGLRTSLVRNTTTLSVLDLDRPLLALAIEEMKRAHPTVDVDAAIERQLHAGLERLRNEIRREAWVEMRVKAPEGDVVLRMPRPKVLNVTEQVVSKIAQAVREVLGEGGVHPRALGAMVLVGPGASFAPIAQALTALTTLEPQGGLDPDEIVLLGMARGAEARASLERTTRADMMENDIGIGLPGGRFHALITAGTRLPTKLNRKHATTRDNQTELDLALFEGRGDNVVKCTPLANAVLAGLPKGARGQINVDVEIELDADAVLSIELTEPKSGLSKKLVMPTSQTPLARRKELEARPKEPDKTSIPPPRSKSILGRLFGKG